VYRKTSELANVALLDTLNLSNSVNSATPTMKILENGVQFRGKANAENLQNDRALCRKIAMRQNRCEKSAERVTIGGCSLFSKKFISQFFYLLNAKKFNHLDMKAEIFWR